MSEIISFDDQIAQLRADGMEILTMEDCIDEMVVDLIKGKEKGSSTYIKGLDNAWTWKLGEFNIHTGYTNEGKSQFIRFMTLIKALEEANEKDPWKFAFYAPEDFPAKEFFDDLIHTASGRSTDNTNSNYISKAHYLQVYEQIKGFFYFNYAAPPKNTLLRVLKSFIPLITEKKVKGVIIDPLIKLARPTKYIAADDKYAMYVTTLCTDFARTYRVSTHLVMHQLTPRLQENGLYPKPSVYNIKGGGTWGDGTDNILSTQRPLYAKDKVDTGVVFTSQKIKKQKLVGLPQEFKMTFNRYTNRYMGPEGEVLYDFDRRLGNPSFRLDLD